MADAYSDDGFDADSPKKPTESKSTKKDKEKHIELTEDDYTMSESEGEEGGNEGDSYGDDSGDEKDDPTKKTIPVKPPVDGEESYGNSDYESATSPMGGPGSEKLKPQSSNASAASAASQATRRALLKEEREKRVAAEGLLQRARAEAAAAREAGKAHEVRALRAERGLREEREAHARTREAAAAATAEGGGGGGGGGGAAAAAAEERVRGLERALNRAVEDLKARELDLRAARKETKELQARAAAAEAARGPSPPAAARSAKRLDRDLTKEELEEELFRAGERLVAEGERAARAQAELQGAAGERDRLRADVDTLRGDLVAGLTGGPAGGGPADPANYANVPLAELLRLRVVAAEAAADGGGDDLGSVGSHRSLRSRRGAGAAAKRGGGGGAAAAGGEADAAAEEVGGIRAVEVENRNLQARCKRLSEKLELLMGELAVATGANDDVAVLKAKATQLVQRQKQEKEKRLAADRRAALAHQKVEALSDHIEKLMFHLKHEAAAKAKALGAQRRVQKEVELLKARNAALARRNGGRERVIAELKEGAKILEDQLRLMDEKYMELRAKLDWQRSKSERELGRHKREAADLRRKWAVVNPDGSLLDEVEVDPAMSAATLPIRMGKKGSTQKKRPNSTSGQGKGISYSMTTPARLGGGNNGESSPQNQSFSGF